MQRELEVDLAAQVVVVDVGDADRRRAGRARLVERVEELLDRDELRLATLGRVVGEFVEVRGALGRERPLGQEGLELLVEVDRVR